MLQGYATCDNHVFSPTKLGLGLVEGYDSLDLQMSQPTLRAHMERELNLVSRGAKRKEDVVRETLEEMLRVFKEVDRNAATLERAIATYFTPNAMDASAQLVAQAFSECGNCGGLCDLKVILNTAPARVLLCFSFVFSRTTDGLPHPNECPPEHKFARFLPPLQWWTELRRAGDDQLSLSLFLSVLLLVCFPAPFKVTPASGHNKFETRYLVCDTCGQSLRLPGRHALHPLPHKCPICRFTALEVCNEEKNTKWTVCPYCYNNPPLADVEDANKSYSQGFPCFQCTRADCQLAKGFVEKQHRCRATENRSCRATHHRRELTLVIRLCSHLFQHSRRRVVRTCASLRCVRSNDGAQGRTGWRRSDSIAC